MAEASEVERLVDAVNQHGYGFQAAVLTVLKRLFAMDQSDWGLEVTEFPVEVQGQGTRIDFILRSGSKDICLIAECKRVNAEYHDWVFAKMPHIARNWHEQYVVESLSRSTASIYISGGVRLKSLPDEIYHVGLPAKKKESRGNRDQIEEAATQVMRAVNGLVMYLRSTPNAFEAGQNRVLVPVIFTTATLWAIDTPLTEVDVSSGDLEPSKCNVREVPYLYYQYHASPGIKHDLSPRKQNQELSAILQSEFVRTIAVVNARGIGEFITKFDPRWMNMGDLDS